MAGERLLEAERARNQPSAPAPEPLSAAKVSAADAPGASGTFAADANAAAADAKLVKEKSDEKGEQDKGIKPAATDPSATCSANAGPLPAADAPPNLTNKQAERLALTLLISRGDRNDLVLVMLTWATSCFPPSSSRAVCSVLC